MANVKQYAMLRAMQDEEYQEVHEVIEYMNEKQEQFTSTMERKQKLMGEVLEFRERKTKKLESWMTGSRRRIAGKEDTGLCVSAPADESPGEYRGGGRE